MQKSEQAVWEEVYSLATKIETLEPWKHFWDKDIICLERDEELTEDVYVSVLGRADNSRGINVYFGIDGLADFVDIMESSGSANSTLYTILNQNALAAYWGEKAELDEKQIELLKILNIKPASEDSYLYFKAFERRVYPDHITVSQAKILIPIFRRLLGIFSTIASTNYIVELEFNQGLAGKYNKDEDKWSLTKVKLPPCKRCYIFDPTEDMTLKRELQSAPSFPADLMMDFVFLPENLVVDEGTGKKLAAFLLFVVDTTNHEMVTGKIMKLQDDELEEASNFFCDYVLQVGRPRSITTPSDKIIAALKEPCGFCNVKLKQAAVQELDDLVEELKNSKDFMGETH